MRNITTLILAACYASMSCNLAYPQTVDRTRCVSRDPQAIEICTAVIQSGHETKEHLAIDYYQRNQARLFQRPPDYEGALADVNQAIRLAPNNAGYLLGRCVIYGVTQQYRRAVDCDNRVIALHPDNFTMTAAVHNRDVDLGHLAQ